MPSCLEVTGYLSEKFFIGLDITGFENTGKYRPISRVTLRVDDENVFTAGDDTGLEITASCPHATQEMVNALLTQLQGYQYQSFTADAVNLDPAAELGDGITVSGIYSTLSQLNDDGNGFPDISAPGEVALEEEYPSAGPMEQEFNQKLAQTRSLISKTSEEILLKVENELEGLSASIDVKLDSITSTVQGQSGQISSIQQTVSSITQQITGINGDISSIEQYVDSITLSVSNGATSSTIQLKAGGTTISSQNITMDGLVTFTGLANGTTTIDGECIKTGTISANRLDLTGSITFSDLSSSVKNDINDAYTMAEDAQSLSADTADTVDRWTYEGTTYIDGGRIMTGTVSASTLEGGEIYLLDDSGRRAGNFTLEGASSYSGRAIQIDSGAVAVLAEYGAAYIMGGGGAFLDIDSFISCGEDIAPSATGKYSCGTSSRKWTDVYAETAEIVTSDREMKNSISYDMSPYEKLFDLLKPTPYKYNNGTSDRTHVGMIAQDVEEAMTDAGLTSLDFAGFIKSPDEEAESGYIYSLRYEEFIAMCIWEIQKIKQRLDRSEGVA